MHVRERVCVCTWVNKIASESMLCLGLSDAMFGFNIADIIFIMIDFHADSVPQM